MGHVDPLLIVNLVLEMLMVSFALLRVYFIKPV